MFTSKRKLFSSERGAATSWLAGITSAALLIGAVALPAVADETATATEGDVSTAPESQTSETILTPRGACSGRSRSCRRQGRRGSRPPQTPPRQGRRGEGRRRRRRSRQGRRGEGRRRRRRSRQGRRGEGRRRRSRSRHRHPGFRDRCALLRHGSRSRGDGTSPDNNSPPARTSSQDDQVSRTPSPAQFLGSTSASCDLHKRSNDRERVPRLPPRVARDLDRDRLGGTDRHTLGRDRHHRGQRHNRADLAVEGHCHS